MSPKTEKQQSEIRATTKTKIDNSSIELFSTKGLSITISEIAKHAQISQGLLYRYYPSKDALIEELVDRAIASSSNAIGDVSTADMSAKDKIESISKMMTWMLIMPQQQGTQLFLFMIQVGLNPPNQSILNKISTQANKPMSYLEQIIKQGQIEGSVKQGDTYAMSMLYWATIQGLCCYSLTGLTIPNCPEILSNLLLK